MRLLVNGTVHPRNRAFYAASAYWFCRPNEMLLLDRYASFGLPSPTGGEPEGFEEGFRLHPHLKAFDKGGDLVYIPKVKGARDKRKGNRWLVIHPELRPILQAYLEWWDERVKRRPDGTPATTQLWITERGDPLERAPRGDVPSDLYSAHFFYDDCERLGLMKPGDRDDPLRRWTGGVQRHFGEQLMQTVLELPDVWARHFRGDKLNKGARDHYHLPKPELVREMYLAMIPALGFLPHGLSVRKEGEAAK